MLLASASSREGTSASVTGPNAIRPCGVATSTSGSSQYMPARAGPDDLDRNAALGGSLLQRQRNLVGADGNRTGIAGDE